LAAAAAVFLARSLDAQDLEQQLAAEPLATLARAAREQGDAQRGAILFFQPHMACAKCHGGDEPDRLLGPDLSRLADPGVETNAGRVTDAQLVEAILAPSKVIRKGYETVAIATTSGERINGLIAKADAAAIVLRDAGQYGKLITIARAEIEQQAVSDVSLMPAGQVKQLTSRQQFLDLVKYLIEIRDGGPQRAGELKPDPALTAALPLPEYEARVNHAGMIRGWNALSLTRGEAIYQRVCANCHGTHDMAGTLPTALRFAEGKFKNGSDPLAMYQTLTRGFGFMVPQTWMVPQQKYDVIHYIREAYLKPRNSEQFVAVNDEYLARLPRGDTFGPAPSNIEPWVVMDYGPRLINTYEIPRASGSQNGGLPNFAYKGIAVRLDNGAGGVSRGREFAIFDHDTLRLAAAWSGAGFIDWNGIHFNGRHQIHPTIVGSVLVSNPVGAGWANPQTGSFDDPRLRGRDDRPYGPLPREWARYRGLYQHGERTIVSYTVGTTDVLESMRAESPAQIQIPGAAASRPATQPAAGGYFVRDFHIGPRDKALTLLVATRPQTELRPIAMGERRNAAVFVASSPMSPKTAEQVEDSQPAEADRAFRFGGSRQIEIEKPRAFDLTNKDYSIVARIRTRGDGTIFSQAAKEGEWIPDGKAFFVRGGKLVFDIGWVGAVTSKTNVADGRWHTVGMSWQRDGGVVRLYLDGKLDGSGRLLPKADLQDFMIRVGFAATNFPKQSYFLGDMRFAAFHQRALSVADFSALASDESPAHESALAAWNLQSRDPMDLVFRDLRGQGHDGKLVEADTGAADGEPENSPLVCGLIPTIAAARWRTDTDGRILLDLPAGADSVQFSVWLRRAADFAAATQLARDAEVSISVADLTKLTHGSAARWPQRISTRLERGRDDGPFAVDVLTPPEANPWLAQTRLTGLDFFADGDRAAVCSWDGDVWLLSGLRDSSSAKEPAALQWQRIAAGLFQPLGLKILDGQIYVTCRDQIAILRDLNGDGETDFYECFNNDHQVTEHFHEFAMGLQADADGNLYYAKSARHALPALVPHHGTLLRVSRDGLRTEILANGFRAANGVCLNPDGSFVVTDQEGHWNPKNRINWVTPGPPGKPRFYGNLFGYHDVTDASDDAMEPPLCWITNEFDRSPAELLWVNSKSWGPLDGALLNLSYGNGKVFVVPHESVRGVMQGGLVALPLPAFPTGIMRGRFHPQDGHLYVCGMFAWAGSATQPGGLYRIRATGRPIQVPVKLRAKKSRLLLTFTEPLDPAGLDPKAIQIKTWSLKRTANYGSKHYDEKPLAVRATALSTDGRTLTLEIPELAPTWCMEIKYSLRSAAGQPVMGALHNSIHELAD
jgi:putative heme-binding domain-containing protein